MTRTIAGITALTTRQPRREAAGRLVAFSSRPVRAAGVTVLELMLTVAMIAVLSAVIAPFMANTIGGRSLDLFASQAADVLREAQFSAMNGKGAARFGVHFGAGEFVLFAGPAYNAADPANLAYPLDNDIVITAITLTGGGADVHCVSHRGIPAEDGTVVFADGAGRTKTVTIGAAGMIDVD